MKYHLDNRLLKLELLIAILVFSLLTHVMYQSLDIDTCLILRIEVFLSWLFVGIKTIMNTFTYIGELKE